MRKGNVLLVMVAVLAMAGAAGAQTPSSCADLAQFGDVTVIEFEGIATGLGGINAVNLSDPYTEFPGITLSRGSATGLWVGEPNAADGDNCTGFYGNDFFPKSGTAVFSPENCDASGGDSGSPVGSVIVDFDNPAFAVGLWFLDPEGAQSSIKAYDGPLGTGNLLGTAIAQNEPDNAQAFRFLNSDGNIHSVVIQLGGGGDGVGMDDLCYVTPPPFEVNLCAAQEIPAGNVTVEQNGDILTVNYAAASGYEFTEIHVDVGCIVEDEYVGIPVNKQNQPKIGEFEYSIEYDEPVTMDSFDFNLCDIPAECSFDDLIIAAHAVVTDVGYCVDNSTIYGVHQGVPGGAGAGFDLFAIDVTTDSGVVANPLFATNTTPPPGDASRLNGLAFDPSNDDRLYYSTSPSGTEDLTASTLWYHELGSGVESLAGDLSTFDVGATFFDGAYYYIANCSADVRRVTIDPITNTVIADQVVVPDFNGENTDVYRFGDIVILDGGILFGSAQVVPSNYIACGGTVTTPKYNTFFNVDLDTGDYLETGAQTVGTRQLALGADGLVYSHNAGSGEFSVVDVETGTEMSPSLGAATCVPSGNLTCANFTGKFNDLASGCIPPTETAWGDACDENGVPSGESFTSRGSWATYFEYTEAQEPVCNQID